jgi:hypothetical protein
MLREEIGEDRILNDLLFLIAKLLMAQKLWYTESADSRQNDIGKINWRQESWHHFIQRAKTHSRLKYH